MNKVKEIFKENIPYIIFLIIFIISLQTIISPTRVIGISMEPTLNSGNFLFVNRINRNYENGDIVTISRENQPTLIKRIIGMEGDTIEFKNGEIYLNNKLLKEDYTIKNNNEPDRKIEIPEGKIYVMGDNRLNSEDSRNLGFFDYDAIDGLAYFRLYPISKFGLLK